MSKQKGLLSQLEAGFSIGNFKNKFDKLVVRRFGKYYNQNKLFMNPISWVYTDSKKESLKKMLNDWSKSKANGKNLALLKASSFGNWDKNPTVFEKLMQKIGAL